MKKPKFKRIIAFIIDVLLVYIIALLFAKIEILNPYIEKYEEISKEYETYFSNIDNITKIDNEIINDYAYKLSKYSLYTNIISYVMTVLYFVIFQFFNKGKTLGKDLMKIKVVNKENKDASFLQILGRNAIMNGVVTGLVLLIGIVTLSKGTYIKLNSLVTTINMIIMFSIIATILIRDDSRGVHDLICGTKVENIDYLEELNNNVKKRKRKEK